MKKLAVLGLTVAWWLSQASMVRAVGEPLAYDNNKVGVHILHPGEIEQAAKLVNGKRGSWGYVTVPIETTDRNREKWNRFMKKAQELKVIPIVRIATLVRDAKWEEPENLDLIAFANFLNDLDWPTKNRYVVVFNEVNRSDEFGGKIDPERYADILVNTSRIFKDRSEDFFILPAGLDLAAANGNGAIQWQIFWQRAYRHNPKVFAAIDGWTSHSYPNPGFVGQADDQGAMSIAGFKKELEFVSQFTDKKLPVFITETGWDQDRVGQKQVAQNFRYAFDNVWSDVRVVAVTPFLLQAGEGPFEKFSLLDKSGQPTVVYEAIRSQATVGKPKLAEKKKGEVLGVTTQDLLQGAEDSIWQSINNWWQVFFGWLRGPKESETVQVKVANKLYVVEVADDPVEHSRGLSEKEQLASNEGMLFVFEEEGQRSFWMKGMKFDIEIIWIKNGQVIGVSPADHTRPYKTYVSPERVDKVLEVRPKSGIQVGDQIKILN